MTSYESVLSPKGILYAKCTFRYFLSFLLVITFIPSTFAINGEIFPGTPFDSNPFFQTTYSLIVGFLVPIIIRETFNKGLDTLLIKSVYILFLLADEALTIYFTYCCYYYLNDSFFLIYFAFIEILFIIYCLEIKYQGLYLSKYLNILGMTIDFLASLIFLAIAIRREYVDRSLGYFVIISLLVLVTIIIFLNAFANLCANEVQMKHDPDGNEQHVHNGEEQKDNEDEQKENEHNQTNEQMDDESIKTKNFLIKLSIELLKRHDGNNVKKVNEKKKMKKTCNICDKKKKLSSEDKYKNRIYWNINKFIIYPYFALNFLCSITFAMISGPSIWWSQLYLTINSTEYSIYQNSGPDTLQSIFKHPILEHIFLHEKKRDEESALGGNGKKQEKKKDDESGFGGNGEESKEGKEKDQNEITNDSK